MNNSTHTFNWARSAVLSLLAGILITFQSGCLATTSTTTRRQASQQEDMAILNEKIRRLDGDIESLSLQMDQLRLEMGRMQDQDASASRSQADLLESSVSTIEDRIRDLEARRESDRLEIVDTLSKRMAEIVENQTPSSPPPRTSTPATSGYGYEHVVQSGENLSRIAQAYKTTMKAIIDANNLQNPNNLRVGQRLFIPE